jgi:hypothetical protein
LREKIGWFPISFVEFIVEDDDVVEEGEDAEVVPIEIAPIILLVISY